MNTKRLLLTALIAAPMIGVMQADMGINYAHADITKADVFAGINAKNADAQADLKNFADAKPAIELIRTIQKNYDGQKNILDNKAAFDDHKEEFVKLIEALRSAIELDLNLLTDDKANATLADPVLASIGGIEGIIDSIIDAAQDLGSDNGGEEACTLMGVTWDTATSTWDPIKNSLQKWKGAHADEKKFELTPDQQAYLDEQITAHPLFIEKDPEFKAKPAADDAGKKVAITDHIKKYLSATKYSDDTAKIDAKIAERANQALSTKDGFAPIEVDLKYTPDANDTLDAIEQALNQKITAAQAALRAPSKITEAQCKRLLREANLPENFSDKLTDVLFTFNTDQTKEQLLKQFKDTIAPHTETITQIIKSKGMASKLLAISHAALDGNDYKAAIQSLDSIKFEQLIPDIMKQGTKARADFITQIGSAAGATLTVDNKINLLRAFANALKLPLPTDPAAGMLPPASASSDLTTKPRNTGTASAGVVLDEYHTNALKAIRALPKNTYKDAQIVAYATALSQIGQLPANVTLDTRGSGKVTVE